ncbi:MAG: hypothetical protein B6241_09965 [Spirochaetaceae bacterium 4572_59]|nr:MAG: hypothetical protein B6241_09965 [Spirochaetaceae bacterium 4572_59]
MQKVLNVLIVDDEHYVIEGLKKHIDWQRLGLNIIGEASDGQSGYEKAMILHPDIIITDIYMPEMDGLEMISRLKEEGLSSYCIVYSGYDDFEYAKQSISCGVLDYLLKPSFNEEIEETLDTTAKRFRKERNNRLEIEKIRSRFEENKKMLLPQFVWELLTGRYPDNEECRERSDILGLNISGKSWFVMGLALLNTFKKFSTVSIEEQFLILYQIISTAEKVLPEKTISSGFHENSCYFIIPVDKDNDQKRILQWAHSIVAFCLNNLDIQSAIGVGQQVDCLIDLPKSYRNASICIRDCRDNNLVVFYSEFRKFHPLEVHLPDTESTMLINDIISGNHEDTKKQIDGIFQKLSAIPSGWDNYTLPVLFELLGTISTSLLKMGVEIDSQKILDLVEKNQTLAQTRNRLLEFIDYLFDLLKDKQNSKNYKIIQMVIEFVRENYGRNITLNIIADELHMSPNYISTVFSKHYGMSFSKYFTNFRIEKAKDFLNSGKYRIYEVADKVGFNNTEYFSKVFKEVVGVTPSTFLQNFS